MFLLRNFCRLGFGIDFLQPAKMDLLAGVLAVAALDNFRGLGAIQAPGAFRHEQPRAVGCFPQGADGS